MSGHELHHLQFCMSLATNPNPSAMVTSEGRMDPKTDRHNGAASALACAATKEFNDQHKGLKWDSGSALHSLSRGACGAGVGIWSRWLPDISLGRFCGLVRPKDPPRRTEEILYLPSSCGMPCSPWGGTSSSWEDEGLEIFRNWSRTWLSYSYIYNVSRITMIFIDACCIPWADAQVSVRKRILSFCVYYQNLYRSCPLGIIPKLAVKLIIIPLVTLVNPPYSIPDKQPEGSKSEQGNFPNGPSKTCNYTHHKIGVFSLPDTWTPNIW